MSTGASYKRGQSDSAKGTPQRFVEACVERFGEITFDLAADAANCKRPNFFSVEQNSLVQDWHKIPGILWLNPPFDKITPWAAKCWAQAQLGARILMLVPASVGSNWYRNFVYDKAVTVFINGRIRFIGESNGFPKDLMLCAYGSLGYDRLLPGYDLWTPNKEDLK